MLVLSRRLNEKILFPGIHAAVQVVSVKSGVVRLGIDAPPEVVVLREEVRDRAAEWNQPLGKPEQLAAETNLRRINDLLRNRLKVATTGLAVLQRQLEAGAGTEAEATLRELVDDLHLLQERVAGEINKKVSRPAARPVRALLVEDDRNERELLASYLRMAGMCVDTAGDGTDALDYLRSKGRPDVVLLDMGMPRCDGPTAVREIRRNPALADLKIFAVTGHLPEEYDLKIGPGGIDRWFHKPLDPAALVQNLTQELATAPGGR